jgi:excisionase family DNA binding protein
MSDVGRTVAPVTDTGQHLPEGILLSAGTAADMMGVSRRHVTRLAKDGALPFAWRAGTTYVFTTAAVQHYIDTHPKDS